LQTGQAQKYAYAVLGAGRQGTAAAYDMAKFGSASKVTIGDVDLRQARRAASHVNRLIGRKVAEGARVEVRRPAQIKRFLNSSIFIREGINGKKVTAITLAGSLRSMCVNRITVQINCITIQTNRTYDWSGSTTF
jgi:glycine/D-amino acid oxidase-like deaminating enzyme